MSYEKNYKLNRKLDERVEELLEEYEAAYLSGCEELQERPEKRLAHLNNLLKNHTDRLDGILRECIDKHNHVYGWDDKCLRCGKDGRA